MWARSIDRWFFIRQKRRKVEDFIKNINNSNKNGAKIVTEVVLLDVFYKAENYHKDYFAKNPNNSYCLLVINPKLEKVQKKYAEFILIANTHEILYFWNTKIYCYKFSLSVRRRSSQEFP